MSGLTGFILIIDDSDRFLSVVETAYQRTRLEVVGVKSVAGAKRVLLERHPEAILCGLKLKGDVEAGIHFAAEMKQHPELSKIPIMLITSELNDGLIRKAADHGAEGLIAWPATVQMLRTRLERYIPDYLMKEPSPEEKRARLQKANPAPLASDIEVAILESKAGEFDSGAEKLDLAKRILAQVLHNLTVEGALVTIGPNEVPRVVSEMTRRVCKTAES